MHKVGAAQQWGEESVVKGQKGRNVYLSMPRGGGFPACSFVHHVLVQVGGGTKGEGGKGGTIVRPPSMKMRAAGERDGGCVLHSCILLVVV